MSKITLQARSRCAAHSLQDQFEQLRAIHAVEVAALAVRQQHDMRDVEKMLDADSAWGGHRARLVLPLDGAD